MFSTAAEDPIGTRVSKRIQIKTMVRRRIPSEMRVHQMRPDGSGVNQGIETEAMVKEGSRGGTGPGDSQVRRGFMKRVSGGE